MYVFSLLQFQGFIWTDRASFSCKIIFLPISLRNAPCIKRARQLAIDPRSISFMLRFQRNKLRVHRISTKFKTCLWPDVSSNLYLAKSLNSFSFGCRLSFSFSSSISLSSLFSSSYFYSFLYVISVVLNPNVFLTGHLIGHSICLLLRNHYPAKVFPEYSLEYWPEDFLCSF